MDINENKKDILELLIQQEEKISQLYKEYAGKFPDHTVFWLGLAAEEKSHASQLRMLSPIIMSDKIKLNTQKINQEKIIEDISDINNIIKSVSEKNFALNNAIQLALSIENTFIEREFFKSCEGDYNDLRETLHGLAQLTENHANRLIEFSKQHKTK